jgi:hypothetical protein
MDMPQYVIDYLDSLDENVEEINLSKRRLKRLPNLSKFTNVKELYCYNNQIKVLDKLPDGLKELYCYNNTIKELNNLPNKLQVMLCSNNQIQELNNLPDGLIELNCSHNQIQELNNLPRRLEVLYCNENPLPSFDINILKEIDRRKQNLNIFILGMYNIEFDNDDIFRKIGEYVLKN